MPKKKRWTTIYCQSKLVSAFSRMNTATRRKSSKGLLLSGKAKGSSPFMLAPESKELRTKIGCFRQAMKLRRWGLLWRRSNPTARKCTASITRIWPLRKGAKSRDSDRQPKRRFRDVPTISSSRKTKRLTTRSRLRSPTPISRTLTTWNFRWRNGPVPTRSASWTRQTMTIWSVCCGKNNVQNWTWSSLTRR